MSSSISELYSKTQAKKLYYRETCLDATKPIKRYFPYNVGKVFIYDKPTKITNKVNTFVLDDHNMYEQNNQKKQIYKLKTKVTKLQELVESERRIQHGIIIVGMYLVVINAIPWLF